MVRRECQLPSHVESSAPTTELPARGDVSERPRLMAGRAYGVVVVLI